MRDEKAGDVDECKEGNRDAQIKLEHSAHPRPGPRCITILVLDLSHYPERQCDEARARRVYLITRSSSISERSGKSEET